MAGCDHRCRFLMVSVKCPGSTNDAYAFLMSDFCQQVLSYGLLPQKYFIIGDEAFGCTEQLLTPFGGTGLDIYSDSFNFQLSSMRQCIERAFGILTRRFGIFWKPFEFRITKWSQVVHVCCKLHNFCIAANESVESLEATAREPTEILYNSAFPEDRPRNHSGQSVRRNTLKNLLSEKGIVRPIYSSTVEV